MARGLARRCPRCGAGGLFGSWTRMVERCPACAMPFQREEGAFLGSFVLNLGAVLVVLAAYIGVAVAATLPEPPAVALALGGAALAVAVPVAFYPFSRTLWSAVDLAMRPLGPDEVPATGPGEGQR